MIKINRILCPTDLSTESDEALRYAVALARIYESAMNFGISLAQEYQAQVHLMHVLDTAGHEEPELAWSSASTGSAYTFTARKLQETLPKEVHLWCNFINVVRCGKVPEEILSYAKQQEIDLICMGVSGSDWTIDKLLGSNVDRVLREAPCPILIASYRNDRYSNVQN